MAPKSKRNRKQRVRRRNATQTPQLPLGLPFRPPRQSMATITYTQEVKVPINQNVSSDAHYSFYPLNPRTIPGLKDGVKNATDYRILRVTCWGESATATSTQFLGLGNALQSAFQDGHTFRDLISIFRVLNFQKRSGPGSCMNVKWGIRGSPWKLLSDVDEVSVPALFFGVADHGTFTQKVALFEFTLTVQYLSRWE